MSELRIALVAEGTGDFEIIQAALKAFLEQPFIMTLLQPEPTQPKMGGGWAGVNKWCDKAGSDYAGHVENDPLLEQFDLIIIHLDVDVALKQYSDYGQTLVDLALQKNWHALPCAQQCPPVSSTCSQLKLVLLSWLRPVTLGPKTVLCLPAQSSGTWLAAASLRQQHQVLNNAECDPGVEDALSRLPLKERIRKSGPEYRKHAFKVTNNWPLVKNVCPQAQLFEDDIRAAL